MTFQITAPVTQPNIAKSCSFSTSWVWERRQVQITLDILTDIFFKAPEQLHFALGLALVRAACSQALQFKAFQWKGSMHKWLARIIHCQRTAVVFISVIDSDFILQSLHCWLFWGDFFAFNAINDLHHSEVCRWQIALPIIWGNRDLVLEFFCINNLTGPEALLFQISALAFKILEGQLSFNSDYQ